MRQFFSPEKELAKGTATLRFSFSKLNPEDPEEAKVKVQPLVLFLDVCIPRQKEQKVDKILSNTLAVPVDVSQ